jgi:predicted TIM-barrel fold metal-dependent hydrolase
LTAGNEYIKIYYGGDRMVIDAHCHFFNAGFAIREAITIGWNKLWGKYPYKKITRGMAIQQHQIQADLSRDKEWPSVIEYIVNLLGAAFGSCQGNFEESVKKFDASGMSSQKPLVTAPLMMDIYFMFDDNTSEVGGAAVPMTRSIGPDYGPLLEIHDEEKFKEHVANVQKQVMDMIRQREAGAVRAFGVREDKTGEINALFMDIENEFITGSRSTQAFTVEKDDDLSPGYRTHLKELVDLQKNNPKTVLPFLAIDPRRHGMMDLVKTYVNRESGPFRGIKLYPPLGYLPSHPNLEELYTYCIDNDIPITAHTSYGGLGNARKRIYVRSFDKKRKADWVEIDNAEKRRAYFAHPDNWVPVLEKYKNLRLNLAHFGGGKECLKYYEKGRSWTNSIIDLIETYGKDNKNLFCDMSYYTELGLEDKIAQIIRDHPIVEDRLMFGTDYIMMMMDYKIGGLDGYFNRYKNLIENLKLVNAKRFLGIQ